MRAPYQLKQGQSRLFHRLPSGLGMEVIFQRGTRNDPDKEEEEKSGPKNPPLVFIHGSFHAAWCWAEHWLPFFSGSGFDCYALSLLGQVFQLSSFYLSLGPFCELGFSCLALNLWILLWVALVWILIFGFCFSSFNNKFPFPVLQLHFVADRGLGGPGQPDPELSSAFIGLIWAVF